MIRDVVIEILNTTLRDLKTKCPLNITDLVFLEIEKNHLPAYESAVQYKGTDHINQFIGKLVREHWDLQSLARNNSPINRLITS